MTAPPIIVWFRQDLRRADNPALHAACAEGAPVVPVYILDDDNAGEWRIGGAGRWWLHHALKSLNRDLSGQLILRKGAAADILPALIQETGARSVYWNRGYEPWRIARDKVIKAALDRGGVKVRSFNGSLLWEPRAVMKSDGTPYKVFTPFFKKGCLGADVPREPLPAPERLDGFPAESLALEDLALLPQPPQPRWDRQLEPHWTISEAAALDRLDAFLADGLKGYKDGRNYPAGPHVSRLSPYLHGGQISPNTVWHAARLRGTAEGWEHDRDHFLSELGWREFSHSLLYHFPSLPRENLQGRFDAFPWQENAEYLERWQKGMTGYPIVDAAMRELWQTGYMHNRARMIVGSFLVKNLLLHWHHGAAWFWDCLADADLANNSASWQWIAGCGADAAPYFRIFNPVTQGEKFDPDGDYVRRYVPELTHMDNKYIHKPWESPNPPAGYPPPIVDHKQAREKALAAFEKTKNAA